MDNIFQTGKTDLGFRVPLEKGITDLFKAALKVSLKRPRFFLFLMRFIARQRKAAKLRRLKERKGINIPPFMIVSVTGRCNLNCAGCYSKINHDSSKKEMTDPELESILRQAEEIGTSISLIAGGEPLKRDGLFDLTAKFPSMLFPVFSNGLLINENIVQYFRKQPNIVPVLSIEGTEDQTDKRRGLKIHEKVLEKLSLLRKNNVFTGVSFTVTTENYDVITDPGYLSDLLKKGVKLFFYNEYVPFEEGTEQLCLSREEREKMEEDLSFLRKRIPAMFVSFPGDESEMGGCLSAGRGFFHVNPAGELEPCPFAPFSRDSLKDVSLEKALQSEFLKTIRDNHENLFEDQGGCALWNNRKWVEKVCRESS